MAVSTPFFITDHFDQATPSPRLPTALEKVSQLFIKIACSNCNMRELCMPIGLNADELKRVDQLVTK